MIKTGWLCLLVAFLLLVGCSQPQTVEASPTPAVSTPVVAGPGFSTPAKWQEHFQKHGREFPGMDADGYLRLAQELRDKPAGGDILEAVQPNGVVSRYERSSGSFVAVNRNRTIRTFFKPRDGERYFKRQINKPHA